METSGGWSFHPCSIQRCLYGFWINEIHKYKKGTIPSGSPMITPISSSRIRNKCTPHRHWKDSQAHFLSTLTISLTRGFVLLLGEKSLSKPISYAQISCMTPRAYHIHNGNKLSNRNYTCGHFRTRLWCLWRDNVRKCLSVIKALKSGNNAIPWMMT